jgi:hypothetical protein
VFSHGGRKDTGLDAIDWAKKAVALGAGEIVLNSIDADGTKAGFDLVITRRVSEAVGVPVVASGGAGTLEHMADVLLAGKADAVLAASILKRFLAFRQPFRHRGKRRSVKGLEVYVPLVDDDAIDAVIRRPDGSFITVQIKARSKDVVDGDAALFAAIPHELQWETKR